MRVARGGLRRTQSATRRSFSVGDLRFFMRPYQFAATFGRLRHSFVRRQRLWPTVSASAHGHSPQEKTFVFGVLIISSSYKCPEFPNEILCGQFTF